MLGFSQIAAHSVCTNNTSCTVCSFVYIYKNIWKCETVKNVLWLVLWTQIYFQWSIQLYWKCSCSIIELRKTAYTIASFGLNHITQIKTLQCLSIKPTEIMVIHVVTLTHLWKIWHSLCRLIGRFAICRIDEQLKEIILILHTYLLTIVYHVSIYWTYPYIHMFWFKRVSQTYSHITYSYKVHILDRACT